MFSELYSYRPRIREDDKRDREPLEDWLTECMAAVLRALFEVAPPKAAEVLALLSELDVDQIVASMRNYGLRIQTQFHAGEQGRPDMVFWLGDWPWMVCENKVRCPASIEQIEAYRKWQNSLSDKRPLSIQFEPKVAFITHYTKPPECDVIALRWSQVARELRRVTRGLDADSHAKALARSFDDFLEEQQMNATYPSTRAMAAAELFMADGLQIFDLANEMLARAICIGDYASQKTYVAAPDFSAGMIYASRWANRIVLNCGAFVSTGVWFPDTGTFAKDVKDSMGLSVTDAAKVFVTIADESLLSACSGAPEGWHRDEEEFLIFADFASFEGNPDERGEKILDWTETQSRAFRAWAEKQS
ncbi:hypothetical protein [Erythrobacter sp.]|uniref:hypothetical protein n=1 Tax=Erythrobacter sp. TaxID=1042 RepID=UPI001425E6E5|nr:hypothetical protein [Erythrobacter sp.]QIQ86943.1 MAG: hypothetical protein G9473_09775 [Erythrobacter sp.]